MNVDLALEEIDNLVRAESVSLSPESLPASEIAGMSSIRKLRLLQVAAGALASDRSEAYLEVGPYHGKSLIVTLLDNPGMLAVACDNFSMSQGASMDGRSALDHNLARFGVKERVRVFGEDFRSLFARWSEEGLPSVGVYLYDGAHDEQSQYDAIRLAEPCLADVALVIVDDWRHAPDSHSFAEAGTRRAVGESSHRWSLVHDLPARFNGDSEQWWNGVAVWTFERNASTSA